MDTSPTMLSRLQGNAAVAGLGARVRTEQTDLDEGWPDLGELDLVWAALSLHHVADPERLLAQIHGALRPGGLLAMTEMAGPTRVLPDDLHRDDAGPHSLLRRSDLAVRGHRTGWLARRT